MTGCSIDAIRVVRVLLGLLTLVAIGNQLSIHHQTGASWINFFSYFTILSNLISAVVLLITAGPRTPSRHLQSIRALSTINMAVVGIVFALLLRNEDLGSLRPWINFVLHYLMPCAVVVDWLLRPPTIRLRLRNLPALLVFPTAYLAYTLVRGRATGWFPYPFLNPQNVGGYAGVAAYAACITVLFVLVGWAVMIIPSQRQA
ncbi:MAG TPA: Pr6Pr family membrane protein [Steroidobacteraceae bacterium]